MRVIYMTELDMSAVKLEEGVKRNKEAGGVRGKGGQRGVKIGVRKIKAKLDF